LRAAGQSKIENQLQSEAEQFVTKLLGGETVSTLPRSTPAVLLSALRDFFKDNPAWE